MESNIGVSRRSALGRIIYFVPATGIICAGLTPVKVRGATKAAKQDFAYQDKPKQGKTCSSCRLFMLTPSGAGRCQVVDGDISPTGWCLAYSPRV